MDNSLIFDTTGMSGTGVPTNGTDGNLVGVDPLLVPLANNGGSTQTHALQAGSPAINAGNNSLAPAIRNSGDQRGFTPGINGIVDMGAYEFGATEPSATTLTNTNTNTLDIATIRRIFTDALEETELLLDSSSATICRTLPELDLREDPNPLDADNSSPEAQAETKLTEHCTPITFDGFMAVGQ